MEEQHAAGGRSSSRLRDRLARMFRPGTLLRSTCNTTVSASPNTRKPPPPGSYECSSSRALPAADARVDSFLASSRRDSSAVVARTESFSTAVDRIHRRGSSAVAPAPPTSSRFSVDHHQYAPPPLLEAEVGKKTENKEKSPSRHRQLVVRNKTKQMMKLLSNDPYGFSSSEEEDVFSSKDKTLFSSDSSAFYFYTTNNSKKKNNKINKSPAAAAQQGPSNNNSSKPPLPPPASSSRKKSNRRAAPASSCDTCGVRDGLVVSEQLRKGFAVVKRTRDPYADFRSSMVEMIVGRQLFGAPELERLLRSYLSLNAPRHHPVILQAFSDIWVVLHHAGS